MSQSGSKKQTQFNRTEILRAVVADAESMGLRDKDKIEQLTSQVIARLERPQTLPGMEDLVPKSSLRRRPPPTRAEIQAIVQEIMAREEPVKADETKPEIEKINQAEPFDSAQDTPFDRVDTERSERAQGKPTETPIIKKKETKPMTKQTTQAKPFDAVQGKPTVQPLGAAPSASLNSVRDESLGTSFLTRSTIAGRSASGNSISTRS